MHFLGLLQCGIIEIHQYGQSHSSCLCKIESKQHDIECECNTFYKPKYFFLNYSGMLAF